MTMTRAHRAFTLIELLVVSAVIAILAALLFPVGCCMILLMAASNTLLQTIAPDALRGRVMALFAMMFLGMAPFGALLAGFLAESIGARWTVGLCGAACLLGGLLLGRPRAGR